MADYTASAYVRTMATSSTKSLKGYHKLGPYSRRLRRGIIADTLDGRSTLGRFCRDLEAQLIAHVGGRPSITARMLIDRAIKIRVQLDLLDEELVAGNWTPHDQRTYGGLLNAHRLTIRELGMAPAGEKTASLVRLLADASSESRIFARPAKANPAKRGRGRPRKILLDDMLPASAKAGTA